MSCAPETSSGWEPQEPFEPGRFPEIPGGWTTRDFRIAGRTFRVTLPAVPDAFLDSPEVIEANERDGYMPYWGYLWPTALDMATAILQSEWTAGAETLELGSGIGVVGLAGLAAGLDVVFSDYDRQAVRLALFNAAQNGWPRARGIFLDWRRPIRRRFPLILGCDLIYEKPNHAPILDALEEMLASDGVCWLADPGRHQADDFIARARERGFRIECRPVPRQPYPGRPSGVTNLWLLRR